MWGIILIIVIFTFNWIYHFRGIKFLNHYCHTPYTYVEQDGELWNVFQVIYFIKKAFKCLFIETPVDRAIQNIKQSQMLLNNSNELQKKINSFLSMMNLNDFAKGSGLNECGFKLYILSLFEKSMISVYSEFPVFSYKYNIKKKKKGFKMREFGDFEKQKYNRINAKNQGHQWNNYIDGLVICRDEIWIIETKYYRLGDIFLRGEKICKGQVPLKLAEGSEIFQQSNYNKDEVGVFFRDKQLSSSVNKFMHLEEVFESIKKYQLERYVYLYKEEFQRKREFKKIRGIIIIGCANTCFIESYEYNDKTFNNYRNYKKGYNN